MTRTGELLWVLDHMDDVESDMSAVHGVDDVHALTGPRFFKFACRLGAYPGVMRLHLEAEVHAERTEQRSDDSVPVSLGSGPVSDVPSSAARSHTGFMGDGREFPPVFGPRR